MTAALEVTGLHKSYGARHALRGVDVAVADRGDGSRAQRDLPRDDSEQIGHRQGDQEDEEVLPHPA